MLLKCYQSALALAGKNPSDDTLNPNATNLGPRPFNKMTTKGADAEAKAMPEPPFCGDHVAAKLKEAHEKSFSNQNIEVWSLYSGGGFAGFGTGHYQVKRDLANNSAEFFYYPPGADPLKPQVFPLIESELAQFESVLAEKDFTSPVVYCPASMDAFAFSYHHVQYPITGSPVSVMYGSFLGIDSQDKPKAVDNISKAFDYLKKLKAP